MDSISYTGVDIDANAIALAQTCFTGKQFRFFTTSVEDHAKSGAQYDYILVAGMLHHVDDATALSILQSTRSLAGPNALINIFDPDTVTNADPLHMRLFYKLEQGPYMRNHASLGRLIESSGLHIRERKTTPIKPGLPGLPAVARFSCFIASWQKS